MTQQYSQTGTEGKAEDETPQRKVNRSRSQLPAGSISVIDARNHSNSLFSIGKPEYDLNVEYEATRAVAM